MKRWMLAAGLVAASVVPPAAAADLGDGTYAPWQNGDHYYDDSRRSHGGYYENGDDDDGAYNGSYRRRYSEGYQSDERCVRSEQVRERLTRRGWHDFRAGSPVTSTVVTLRARSPSGRLFELKLDRCSGDIIATRPLELRPFGPYASRDHHKPYSRHWHRDADAPPYADHDRWNERPYAYRGSQRRDDDD